MLAARTGLREKGEDGMLTEPHPAPKQGRPRNEAVALYEMNADEVFRDTGCVVIDSSLGLVLEPAPRRDHVDPAAH